MRIAICDPSYNFMNAVRSEILKMNRNNFVYLYSNYSDLINNISISFDAIIINTEIGSESGIEVSLKIKREYPKTEIISATQFGEKYAQTIFYHTDILRPYAFFVKPLNRAYLRRVIVFLEQEILKKQTGDIIVTCTNGSAAAIPVAEVTRIEHNNRISVIYDRDGSVYECRKKLSVLERSLPESLFFYCSKSCIVNVSEVSLMSGQEIVMKNNDRVFASRNYKLNFKKALDNYNLSLRKVSEIEELLV